jgi:PPOX class probable F420-dependent enzyme
MMKLNDSARALIGRVADATLVTMNPNGSPQVSVVWVTLQRTPAGEDELVTAHLKDHQKIRNVRRNPRVALTILSADRSALMTPYLSIQGTARIEDGGAPELIAELARAKKGLDTNFPPPNSPPGYLTRIRIDKVGGLGPWVG